MGALTINGLNEAGAVNSVSVVTSSAGISVGSIIWHAGTGTPDGALYCDGSAVSRTAYAELFAAIGTTYGSGDGATTFNIPDLRGLFVRGADGDYSEAMGTEQTDAIRNITGTIAFRPSASISGSAHLTAFWGSAGALSNQVWISTPTMGNTGVTMDSDLGDYKEALCIYLDASNVVPTADENRPVNMAMRPCIIYE